MQVNDGFQEMVSVTLSTSFPQGSKKATENMPKREWNNSNN